jgi:hypothetical protein
MWSRGRGLVCDDQLVNKMEKQRNCRFGKDNDAFPLLWALWPIGLGIINSKCVFGEVVG